MDCADISNPITNGHHHLELIQIRSISLCVSPSGEVQLVSWILLCLKNMTLLAFASVSDLSLLSLLLAPDQ